MIASVHGQIDWLNAFNIPRRLTYSIMICTDVLENERTKWVTPVNLVDNKLPRQLRMLRGVNQRHADFCHKRTIVVTIASPTIYRPFKALQYSSVGTIVAVVHVGIPKRVP